MTKAVFALATAATLGVAALVTPSSPAQAWRGGWGPGLAGGLIVGAVIGGIASSGYAYGRRYGYYGGPAYGYYGGYAPDYYSGYTPAYSNYGYGPEYYGGYRGSYYTPAYHGSRYRRATSKPIEEWSEAAPSPSGKARHMAPPRAMVRNPPPQMLDGQQRQAAKSLDQVQNDQTPNRSALPAPMNAETPRGTATAERPTEAEPPKAELPQVETPKLDTSNAELDPKAELQLAEATTLAERLTATAVGPAPNSDASLSKTDSGADTTGSISKNIDSLTALVLTRLEVGEISDLAGKVVAINGALPGSSVLLRTAIVAAGAPEIQLNDSQAEPIEALRRGEVSAVIFGLVTVEQAQAFPKVENFKIFRVPLSPG
jgi:hypothetical protein